ncbi:hypothetical protein GQ457_12G018100 [Hibiscus cannabinus]
MKIEEFRKNPKCWILASNNENNISLMDEWSAHPFGSAKFNIDGATKGSYGLANICDILRDRFPPKPRKGDESISELVEILSGEAKVMDVELG